MSTLDLSTRAIHDLVSLEGRTAVVTGGAQGIGLGIAQRLAEAGATVVLADLDETAAQAAAATLAEETGGTVLGRKLDVRDAADIEGVQDEIVATAGSLDIWVNNAGIYPSSPILEQTTEEWDTVMDINLRAVYLASREAARRMVAGGRPGVIINISSVAGVKTREGGSAHYNVAKRGVVALTELLAVELGPSGIRAFAIAPGLVATPGTLQHTVYQAYFEHIAATVPLRRTLVPDDIGRVALFLASDLSAAMTGTTVPVDCGELVI